MVEILSSLTFNGLALLLDYHRMELALTKDIMRFLSYFFRKEDPNWRFIISINNTLFEDNNKKSKQK